MARKIQLIAGPCSAESRDQVLDTASALSAMGVDYFRAGLWKPRTRPGCFEGFGYEGLVWLAEARERFGLKIATEVACAAHVEACLKSDVDAMWLGARTTVNPFMAEEIASALAGTDKYIIVKNPVNQDVSLWRGCIERLMSRGISNIGIVHRGFSSFGDKKYRNDPQWHAAIEVRSAFPELPFICDPSHMGGDSRFVPEISQKAMDLGYDGLMVEVHTDPEHALSDTHQQITPAGFERLVSGLRVREKYSEDVVYNNAIERLREEIDGIDRDIVSALARRMEISREIGKQKNENNVSIIQPSRWDEVIGRVYETGDEKGLSREFLSRVFNAIHEASVSEQNKIDIK